MTPSTITGRATARAVLAALYFIVGVIHLARPEVLMPIMPAWVPFPKDVILLTGGCEIAGALALMSRRLRRASGIALALYAVCVFPANIKMAIEDTPVNHVHLGWGINALRLSLQPVLIWWALFSGEVLDWPFKVRSKTPGG